jgi:hypothetical protein
MTKVMNPLLLNLLNSFQQNKLLNFLSTLTLPVVSLMRMILTGREAPKLLEIFKALWLVTKNSEKMLPISSLLTISSTLLKIVSPPTQGLQRSKKMMIPTHLYHLIHHLITYNISALNKEKINKYISLQILDVGFFILERIPILPILK